MTEEEITPAMFEAGNNAQHPDDCTDVRVIYRAMRAAIAIEAQRAVTTQIGTVRSTKARCEAIAQTVPVPSSRERK